MLNWMLYSISFENDHLMANYETVHQKLTIYNG